MADIFALIGRRIKAERTARGVSQQELAEVVATDPGHLSRVEGGKTPPSINLIKAIADALNVPVATLFKDVPIKRPAVDDLAFKMSTLVKDLSPKKRSKIYRVLKSIAAD